MEMWEPHELNSCAKLGVLGAEGNELGQRRDLIDMRELLKLRDLSCKRELPSMRDL